MGDEVVDKMGCGLIVHFNVNQLDTMKVRVKRGVHSRLLHEQ